MSKTYLYADALEVVDVVFGAVVEEVVVVYCVLYRAIRSH